MDIHENARTTPHSRAEIVRRVLEEGWSRKAAAEAFGVCIKTVGKWIDRFLAEGLDGLKDRSSRPHRLRNPTPEAKAGDVIALRRQRLPGDEIARLCGLSPATVSRILRAAKLSRARDLDPPPPIRRYEHPNPGDMIHIDIKKLGRFERIGHRITGDRTRQSSPRGRRQGYGWEFVHICIDDASRLSFTQIHPDEKATSAVAHLKASVAWYQSLGVSVRRVMTDNGPCYKAFAFPTPAGNSASSTSAPSPTRLAPMERPSASSRPVSGSGPTRKPTTPPISAPQTFPSGPTDTTGIVPMAG
jgi:transposase